MRYIAICFSFLGLLSCGTKQLEEKAFRANNDKCLLKETVVKIESDPIGLVSGYQDHGSSFSIVDGYVAQQVFLFNSDGTLKQKIGMSGQGPGEYQGPTAFTKSGSRMYVVGMMDATIHVYDEMGTFLFKKPIVNIPGIISQLLPLTGDRVLAVVGSRYSDKCFYILNSDAELMSSAFPTPNEFNSALDTFFPPLLCSQSNVDNYLSLNFEYKVMVLSENLDVDNILSFASVRYIAPDLDAAKETNNHKTELEFRGSFTQFNGMFSLGDKFVTNLTGWADKSTTHGFLEFWDKDFNSLGYFDIPDGEQFLGTQGTRLLFFDKERSSFVFRERT